MNGNTRSGDLVLAAVLGLLGNRGPSSRADIARLLGVSPATVTQVTKALIGRGLAQPLEALVSRTSKVPSAPYHWSLTDGPWFDNNLATLEVRGRGLVMRWDKGVVQGERYDAPELVRVARVAIS